MKTIVIFASGNGTNAARIAEYFSNTQGIALRAIFCNQPGAYVLERAKQAGISTVLFTREALYHNGEVLQKLQSLSPDLIVLAGFMWLIPDPLLKAFPQRILNIHPALLPAYGGKGMYGMHVHNAVIANKEKESGITIHLVNEKYDAGDILFQAKCIVAPEETPESLAQKIHALEYKNFPEVIESYLRQVTNS
ncbi:MAG: phosphoribosylglycinamide formyltransferase [Bacteroidales bacterium]|nr:phosphoribosylglycinamide formyltransferase [Bacteroidales bacterium]MDD3010764.1 phosphoribosylglycinamide formyltransferase [Bacteroidales bacterium]MDD3961258.1 phosphoribosylglycinamide formyltransferase [Bacteroidales bacterium]MDY0286579.1 phosphoribosylglycinamide formyltransferase [Bacteroidales bacterium]HPE87591.1 phosphoribosylglycinamide formyltransferase [Bacteroidales bacterium]